MVYANRSLKGMFFYRGLLGTDHTVFLHFFVVLYRVCFEFVIRLNCLQK